LREFDRTGRQIITQVIHSFSGWMRTGKARAALVIVSRELPRIALFHICSSTARAAVAGTVQLRPLRRGRVSLLGQISIGDLDQNTAAITTQRKLGQVRFR
jgi:hypothetical protein